MDDSLHIRTGRRRRALWWGLFGLTGIVMGTAYATGFDQAGTALANGSRTNVVGDAATVPNSPSQYAGLLVDLGNDLNITFDGLWGTVPANETLFHVNLTTVTGTFYVDLYLDNGDAINAGVQWSALQLKWLQLPCPSGVPSYAGAGNAATATAGDGEPKLMNVTTADAHVSFSGLVAAGGDDEFCFGIAQATPFADDVNGTFLRRPDTASSPVAPTFTAVVNRSA